MGKDTSTLVLLRFSGDVHIKARATRSQFVRRLLHNLQDALVSEGLPPRVRASHDRLFVELPVGAAVDPLVRVFGVQSASKVEARCPDELAAIVRAGTTNFADRVRGRRFAVRARRVGARDRIRVSPRDVECELGTALLPNAAGVDLETPEFTVRVELMEGEAFLFGEHVAASGGLPLGVEGRAVALLSGGFDSAVASWQLLRRGVAQDYVFCNLGGTAQQLGVLRVAKILADDWHYGQRPKLMTVDFEAVAAELRARTAKRYWQVLLKRLMLRAADRIALQRGATAIITGEAVGQVSSQTLQNLAVISRATDQMILRPLVGTNKEEIIDTARRIGTFELSKVVGEYCDLVPHKPATGARLDAIESEEARMDPGVLAAAVDQCRSFDLRELGEEQLETPELEVTRVPDGATVIDLRGRSEFDSWHHEAALWLEFQRALAAYPNFEPDRTYVLYCDYGLVSAHLAGLMRKDGFDAFHFRGGTRALRRAAEA